MAKKGEVWGGWGRARRSQPAFADTAWLDGGEAGSHPEGLAQKGSRRANADSSYSGGALWIRDRHQKRSAGTGQVHPEGDGRAHPEHLHGLTETLSHAWSALASWLKRKTWGDRHTYRGH